MIQNRWFPSFSNCIWMGLNCFKRALIHTTLDIKASTKKIKKLITRYSQMIWSFIIDLIEMLNELYRCDGHLPLYLWYWMRIEPRQQLCNYDEKKSSLIIHRAIILNSSRKNKSERWLKETWWKRNCDELSCSSHFFLFWSYLFGNQVAYDDNDWL